MCHGSRGTAAAPLGGSSGQGCTSCPSRTTHPTPRPDQSLLADGGTTEIATKLQQPLQPQLMKGDVGACVVGAQHAPFSVCGSRSPAHRSWSTNPPSQLSLSCGQLSSRLTRADRAGCRHVERRARSKDSLKQFGPLSESARHSKVSCCSSLAFGISVIPSICRCRGSRVGSTEPMPSSTRGECAV